MRLEIEDFEEIKSSAIRTFDRAIAQADPSICWEVNNAVDRLESQLIQLYGLMVLAQKKEDNLSVVADTWKFLVGMCDEVARKIGELSEEHPYCAVSHDKVLDLRNRCARICNLHS